MQFLKCFHAIVQISIKYLIRISITVYYYNYTRNNHKFGYKHIAGNDRPTDSLNAPALR